MKIFAIMDEEVWVEVPDSSLLRSGQPFFIPDFAKEFEIRPSVAIRISKLGKRIAPKFAMRYTDSFTASALVVAIDLLTELRKKGLPWAPAVAFDKSVFLGNFLKMSDFNNVTFRIGDKDVDTGITEEMIRQRISMISRHITLKDGDLILILLNMEGIVPAIGTNFEIEYNDNNNNELSKLLEIHIR